jgi:hypothetical protein
MIIDDWVAEQILVMVEEEWVGPFWGVGYAGT